MEIGQEDKLKWTCSGIHTLLVFSIIIVEASGSNTRKSVYVTAILQVGVNKAPAEEIPSRLVEQLPLHIKNHALYNGDSVHPR
jgi:hypothetical protein